MRLLPKTLNGWTIFLLGAFALAMGVLGLVSPSTQLGMMGFESVRQRPPSDHTLAVMAITSLAAVNTATLYMVAAVREWPGFTLWAIFARLVMGTGLATLVVTGNGPDAFMGAATWEVLGAALVGGVAIYSGKCSVQEKLECRAPRG